jgi:lipid-binding SYLF domain-containing protein
MSITQLISTLALATILAVPVAEAATLSDAQDVVTDASSAVVEFDRIPEQAIPDSLYRASRCVAVIPGLVKGGFVVGAKGGVGVVSCRVNDSWSPAAYMEIGGASIGWQVGLEKVQLIMVFTDKDSAWRFFKSNFTIGADASVAIGPVGRNLQAGTDYQLDKAIYTYSRSKGLFVGLSLDGSVVRPDAGYNQVVYPNKTMQDILTSSDSHMSPTTAPFVDTLSQYAH